jgi:hypothetical protein
MDPESKKLLEETFRLAEENNRMLHKVRSVQKWAAFWSGLKIFIIIGITLGAFYFLEPYLKKVMDLYGSVSGTSQEQNVDGSSIQDLLKKF